MDPNETLQLLLAHAMEARLRLDAQDEDWSSNDHLLNSIVNRVVALNEWLVRGGPLPKRWRAESVSGQLCERPVVPVLWTMTVPKPARESVEVKEPREGYEEEFAVRRNLVAVADGPPEWEDTDG